jgi:8-amino-7-oxononanoate synthase
LFAQVLDNARYLHAGLQSLGFRVVEPTKLPDGTEVITPVVPVFIGDEMQTVMLWNLLYEAGLFVNVAIFPAVPFSGALLRTSVMATHDRDTLDRALSIFADVKRVFETHHGPLPAPKR